MIDDELLIAYADGECGDADRTKVEQALANDPDLRERLDQHRRLAARLNAHYGPVVEALVPDRLTDLLRKQPADVIDFSAARQVKRMRGRLPGWSNWGAIAASLAVGVLAGQLALPNRGGVMESRDGVLIARGELAEALDVQLASAQPDTAKVRIGISFKDQSGQYCRSFQAAALSGIGCRSAEGWRLPITRSAEDIAPSGGYRQAGSGDALVMQVATAMMQGEPLDPETELKVRDNGWR